MEDVEKDMLGLGFAHVLVHVELASMLVWLVSVSVRRIDSIASGLCIRI